MLLRKLGLIVWKNLLLRKRQWVVTFFEVFFPVLFVTLIIVLLNSIVSGARRDTQEGPYTGATKAKEQETPTGKKFVKEKDYDESTESDIRQGFTYWSSCSDQKKQVIGYTPKNTETDKLMSNVLTQICPPTSGSGIIAESNEPEIAAFGFNTESELENMVSSKWKGQDYFLGAVVFANGLEALKKPNTGKTVVSYTIRMPSRKGGTHCPSPDKLFPEPGDEDFGQVGPSTRVDKYLHCGFLGFQLVLDKALTEAITLEKRTFEVHSQPIPYPSYIVVREEFQKFAPSCLIIFYVGLAFGSCFVIPSITRNVAAEKLSGISELLRLTGVPGWIQWLGWWIHIVGPQLITISLMLIIMFTLTLPSLQGQELAMLDLADFSLVGAVLLLVVLASVASGLLICAVIKKQESWQGRKGSPSPIKTVVSEKSEVE